MRALLCPASLKGACSATAAAAALARGFGRGGGEAVELPVADGGEGTADAMHAALGGEWRQEVVSDPLGRPVPARWLRLPDGRAVIESAAAIGLPLLAPRRAGPAGRLEPRPRGARPGRAAGRSERARGRSWRERYGRRRGRAAAGAGGLARPDDRPLRRSDASHGRCSPLRPAERSNAGRRARARATRSRRSTTYARSQTFPGAGLRVGSEPRSRLSERRSCPVPRRCSISSGSRSAHEDAAWS